MSDVKIQRQPWIDYLADAMAKETDDNVNKYAPAVKAIIQTVKNDSSKKESSIFVLKSLKQYVLGEARNKSRTENLMNGIIQFTEKL